jgi:vitamin K-dependent gamma-carboxylase
MKEKKHSAQKKQTIAAVPLSSGSIGEIWGRGKWKNLFAPLDISTIVFFRVLFGLIMLIEVSRYFSHGWISAYWIEPKYHFTYWPFHFISPLPGNGMYYLFGLMGILSVCIMIGLFYRASMTLFFLCFSYQFLLEQTRYLNHFYLVILISFVMIFIPAHTSASIDSRIFKNIRSETAPAWSLWLLRFMVGIPYFFGGIAKINTDWLQGYPLRIWLLSDLDFPVIGPLFQYHWMVLLMSYTGLLLDLLIVPSLLFKKTRKWAFPFIALFHIMNSQLFEIGIFPWFMIIATSLYFDPSWFRKFINFISGNAWSMKTDPRETGIQVNLSGKHKVILASLAFWVFIQITVPFRHFFIPGSVHWTEQGHNYSWHMKLRSKSSKAIYTIVDKKSGRSGVIIPERYLTASQLDKVNESPYLIWQFCRIIKKEYEKVGLDVSVYADVKASLNGRKYQQLVDPKVDMGIAPRPVLPVRWIVPLSTPLSEQLSEEENKNPED